MDATTITAGTKPATIPREARNKIRQLGKRIGEFVDLLSAAEDAGAADPYATALAKMKATA